MKIAFITSGGEDYLEVTVLTGLRTLIHNNCVDIPKKKIMYHDWSETNKNQLHGRGFTMHTLPIPDITNRNLENFDFVLYGISKHPNDLSFERPEINNLVDPSRIWYLDGHDLYGSNPPTLKTIRYNDEIFIGVQKTPCFKRELIERVEGAYPIGFGIPNHHIREINFRRKNQLFQKTAPHDSLFKEIQDLGGGFKHHFFNSEDDYYDDLQNSWFGLTCKKGGWDCMRHYEIMAAGTLLLFKDYDKKPELCSPIDIPTISYSTKEQLSDIINRLIINNKPTEEYLYLLKKQRHWLINNGTTTARALTVYNTLNKNYDKRIY
jgi:hypothetical protein